MTVIYVDFTKKKAVKKDMVITMSGCQQFHAIEDFIISETNRAWNEFLNNSNFVRGDGSHNKRPDK